MKVLVITGGNDSEREISLISAGEVEKALEQNNHEVVIFDISNGYSNLGKVVEECDVVFPVLHGKQGEDGKLYKFLEESGIPYVGSDPSGAEIAFNKISFKEYCEENKIPTGRWKKVKNKQDIVEFGLPCVLKAAEGGSSKEVWIINSGEDIPTIGENFYVEELLNGIEVTSGILGDEALPLVEIVPPQGKWFDSTNKYSGETQEIPFAPSLDEKMQKEIQERTLKIHRDLKLKSYSRADYVVKDNVAYILETNTPSGVGFTPESLFPKAAKAVGIDFKKLVQMLVESVNC